MMRRLIASGSVAAVLAALLSVANGQNSSRQPGGARSLAGSTRTPSAATTTKPAATTLPWVTTKPAATTAPAGEAASAAKDRMARYGDLADMIAFLKCPPEQMKKINDLMDRHDQSIEMLEAQQAVKKQASESERTVLKEQMPATDEERKPFIQRLAMLDAQEKELQQELLDLTMLQQAEMQTLFSPDQRFSWNSRALMREFSDRYGGLKLTDAQNKLIEGKVAIALGQMNMLSGSQHDIRRQHDEIKSKLRKDVYNDVLTEANRIDFDTDQIYYAATHAWQRNSLSKEKLDGLRATCRAKAVELQKLSGQEKQKAMVKANEELEKSFREKYPNQSGK